MEVIPPSSTEIVSKLSQLDNLLKKKSTRALFDRLINEGDDSIRIVQAGRYEVFVEAMFKTSYAFDHLTQNKLRMSKQEMICYLKAQVLRDSRLTNKSSYEFGNISFIITYDPVPAQVPHIDMILPNYQCGLILTEGAPGTLYGETTCELATVDDLVRHWSCPPMSRNLRKALENELLVNKLLEEFGKVLLSPTMLSPGDTLTRGTVLTLPGSTVHAGPATTSYRSVLFASVWPKGDAAPRYDPDTQYTSTVLCGHLLSLVWSKIGVKDRKYMLERTVSCIQDTLIRHVSNHFTEGPMAAFLEMVEHDKYPAKMTLKKLILKSAKDDRFVASGDPQKIDKTIIVKIDDLECVSVTDNLMALYGEEWFKVIVYRRPLSKNVMLYYPGEKQWEGGTPTDQYTLTLERPGELFDGSNGILRGSDEIEIRFSRTTATTSKKKRRL